MGINLGAPILKDYRHITFINRLDFITLHHKFAKYVYIYDRVINSTYEPMVGIGFIQRQVMMKILLER